MSEEIKQQTDQDRLLETVQDGVWKILDRPRKERPDPSTWLAQASRLLDELAAEGHQLEGEFGRRDIFEFAAKLRALGAHEVVNSAQFQAVAESREKLLLGSLVAVLVKDRVLDVTKKFTFDDVIAAAGKHVEELVATEAKTAEAPKEDREALKVHKWKPTGIFESATTDPVTELERCEICDSECWHFHGVQGFRFRKSAPRTGPTDPPPTVTKVDDNEPCAGAPKITLLEQVAKDELKRLTAFEVPKNSELVNVTAPPTPPGGHRARCPYSFALMMKESGVGKPCTCDLPTPIRSG